MYCVVCICDTLEDQKIMTQLSFESASFYAACMTAELMLKGKRLTEESYIVQPEL